MSEAKIGAVSVDDLLESHLEMTRSLYELVHAKDSIVEFVALLPCDRFHILPILSDRLDVAVEEYVKVSLSSKNSNPRESGPSRHRAGAD